MSLTGLKSRYLGGSIPSGDPRGGPMSLPFPAASRCRPPWAHTPLPSSL